MSMRIAVAGLGHGSSYLKLLKRSPRAELVAVVDADRDRRESAAAQFSVRDFASLEALLATDLADAVILALPTPVHAEASIAALDAGLHVLQEKPLCRTDDEAAAIKAAVSRSGKVFQVGYEVRSSPFHRSIVEHARRGDLGEVTNVWYNQHTLDHHPPGVWRSSRDNMGGKLFDCAVHYFDLMQQWAGAPVHRLAAFGNLRQQTGPNATDLPESVVVALEYANGVRGTYNFGAVHRLNDDASFGVVGTTGRIMGNPWLPEHAGSYELRQDCGIRKSQVVFDGNLTSTGHLGFNEQLGHFIATVLDGADNACSIDDALAIHDQMRAIDRAMATGQVVTLGAES